MDSTIVTTIEILPIVATSVGHLIQPPNSLYLSLMTRIMGYDSTYTPPIYVHNYKLIDLLFFTGPTPMAFKLQLIRSLES